MSMPRAETEAPAYPDGYPWELYDFLYADMTDDVPFYVDYARTTGGPVLEVASGTGRVLIPIARAGVEAVGLDRQPEMLTMCRQKLSAEPPEVQERIRLVQADARDFELGQRFSLAFIAFNSMLHLTARQDQDAFLACVRRHLAPEGRFIVNMFVPRLELLVRQDGRVRVCRRRYHDGMRATITHFEACRHDYSQQLLLATWFWDIEHDDGRFERRSCQVRLRYVFRSELELLLERGGLEVIERYESPTKAPMGPRAERMFLVARAQSH